MKITEGILPAGWIGLTLEDVAEIHDNLREPVNSSERAKRPGIYPYYGATGQVGWIDDFRQYGEYVLLGEDGAPFFEPTKEKAYLVSGKCWVNNHAHVLKGREGLCSNRYLLYSLNQTNYRGYANGTTRLKLTQSAMRQLPINLAPLTEQNRIVAKIEELFSELDKGIENLKTARAQLKVYRQALLKHAFEGKLTVQWRAENQDKLETAEALLKRIQQERAQRYQQQLAYWEAFGGSKPKAPKFLSRLTVEELAELPELPEGWGWIRLGDVFSDSPKNGIYKSADYYGSGFPIIRIDDFYDGTLCKTSGFKRVRLSEDEIKTFTAHVGDILINRVNSIEYLGKCCEIKGLAEPVVFESNIMKTTLADNLVSNFFVTSYLSSHFGRRRLCVNAKHAVNQASINQTDVSMTPMPLAQLEEQNVISELLGAHLSEVDQLDQTITTALQQADALRQSILKKAFSGQLVPQDPHDEPASALLARIRAERETSKPKSKGKQE